MPIKLEKLSTFDCWKIKQSNSTREQHGNKDDHPLKILPQTRTGKFIIKSEGNDKAPKIRVLA